GATRLLTEQFANRGITLTAAEAGLAFFEHAADSVKLNVWRPNGGVETLRTFTANEIRGARVAMHDERIAWSAFSPDSSRIRVAVRQGVEQILWTLPGAIQEMSWSPNGRWIAALTLTQDRKSCIDLLPVDAPGRARAPRRECVSNGQML